MSEESSGRTNVTRHSLRPAPKRFDNQFDDAVADGVARALRLLAASGEIVWAQDDAEDRVNEVARVAVELARLPETDDAPPPPWLVASVPHRPPRARVGRRKIRYRRPAPRREQLAEPVRHERLLSRWGLVVAFASFILLVVALALQRL